MCVCVCVCVWICLVVQVCTCVCVSVCVCVLRMREAGMIAEDWNALKWAAGAEETERVGAKVREEGREAEGGQRER